MIVFCLLTPGLPPCLIVPCLVHWSQVPCSYRNSSHDQDVSQVRCLLFIAPYLRVK
jgi:hypothetical protein